MRISDWSSYVCSSDLADQHHDRSGRKRMDGLLEQFARPSGRLGSQDCRPHGCKHRKDELMATAAKSETYTFTSFAPAEVAESYIAKARELRPLLRDRKSTRLNSSH